MDYFMYANLIFMTLFDLNIFEYNYLTEGYKSIYLDGFNFAGLGSVANHLKIILKFMEDVNEFLNSVSKSKGKKGKQGGYTEE